MKNPILIGSCADPHVAAVASVLGGQCVIVDAADLSNANYIVNPPAVHLCVDKRSVQLEAGCRGWVRRLSPPAWETGTILGSHDAAVKASWLSVVAAILRHPNVEWLSPFDSMNAAENKLTQGIAASRLGIRFPRTLVSNDPANLQGMSPPLVAKPLGPGHYRSDEGDWLTLFTERFDSSDPSQRDLMADTPFLIQEQIDAQAHLRIVTVHDQAWIFRLDAEGLPLDWRQEQRAHHSWERVSNPAASADALRLSASLGLGYTSQDWCETEGGRVFLDLNPAGQWLFLPDVDAGRITHAIAMWLAS